MANPHNLKVGQTVVFVPGPYGNHKEERHFAVATIGRKYFTVTPNFNNWRIDLETLWVDGQGYSSPGEIKTSVEAWEAEKQMRLTWKRIRERVGGPIPPHLTQDNLDQLLKQLTKEI